MAVDEINSSGGIKQHTKIEMIYEDGECEEDAATKAATKLIYEDKIKYIIGGVCSGETLAAAKIADPAGVIMITPSSSSPVVTLAGEYIFRNTPSDADLGKALAGLVSQKYDTTAVITENTEYAIHLRDVFVQEYENNGGQVLSDELFYSYTSDYSDVIKQAFAQNPQAIFINPQSETAAGKIIKAIVALNPDMPLFGTNIAGGNTALDIAGPAAEGLIIVDNPPLKKSNPAAVQFLDNYNQQYDATTFEFYVGAAYDGIYLFAQALEKVGTDTENIKNYFYKLKNYHGVIGDYRFDSNGDLVLIEYSFKEIKDGQPVEVD